MSFFKYIYIPVSGKFLLLLISKATIVLSAFTIFDDADELLKEN